MQFGLRRSPLSGLNATTFPAKAAQWPGDLLTPFLKQCACRPARQAMLCNGAMIDTACFIHSVHSAACRFGPIPNASADIRMANTESDVRRRPWTSAKKRRASFLFGDADEQENATPCL